MMEETKLTLKEKLILWWNKPITRGMAILAVITLSGVIVIINGIWGL